MANSRTFSPRTERYRERDLVLATYNGVPDASRKQKEEVTETLQRSWQKAVLRFREETGKDLGNYRDVGKDGVLSTLKQRYGTDSKDARKRDEFFGTMEKVLNGVELVAATAFQAASVVFGPADMCFNAIDILLSIPREIKKFAEDLQSLFTEVSSYLENFKVFDRIDQRGMLDIALLKSNNDILINLVEVCMLACKIIQHPVRTILGNVFLKNDAVRQALESFQDLIDKQNKLTSTIILEATLESKASIRQVIQETAYAHETNKDTNIMVTALTADSTESKNLKIDKDRIIKIDKALDLTETMVAMPLEALQRASHIDLESTIALLKDKDEYKQWTNLETLRKVLYISGGSGSGKTNVLSALAQQIEDDKRRLHAQQSEELKTKQQKSDRAIYFTYYSFSDIVKGTDRGKYDTPVHDAFKIIAAQLARQSTRYASALAFVPTLEKLQKGQKTLKQLWNDLKLIDLATIVPAQSVLYIFLDGLDELKDSLKELGTTIKVSASKDSDKVSSETLRLRVIFTGSPETEDKLKKDNTNIGIFTIRMSEINTTLIREYVDAKMKKENILQDDDEESKKVRIQVLEAIPASANGSFAVATQKLRTVTEAIEEDVDPDVLIQKLEVTTFEDEGKRILDHLNLNLSQQHKEQLKELFIWSVYAKTRPELDHLEAALYLQRDKKSLEPLRQKIERRFDKAFDVFDNTVYPKAAIEEVIRLPSDRSLVDMAQPKSSKSTRSFRGENGDQRTLDVLLSYLQSKGINEDDEPQVRPVEANSTDKLTPNERFAEFTILTRLFRALNDDRVRQQARALILYAMDFLPSHLQVFAESIDDASNEELQIVGKGLVNFLRDSESIEAACAVHLPNFVEWMPCNDGTIKSMRTILTNPRVQEQLEHIERRWAKNNTAKGSGRALFLDNMATTIARCWLTDRPLSNSISSWGCFAVIDNYLDMLSIPEPETFDNTDTNSGDADEPGILPQFDGAKNIYVTRSDLVPVVAGNAHLTQKNEKTEPLLGNFSQSSDDIDLKRSTLFASCLNIEGQRVEASINLNDCISSESGHLRWKQDGQAFRNVRNARLAENGTVLEALVWDQRRNRQVRRYLLLDEQISNDDGRLIFLNTASANFDVVSTPDPAAQTDVEITDVSRIKAAEQWAMKTLKIHLDYFALGRIGQAFLTTLEIDEAIQYLTRAAAERNTSRNAVALAQAFAEKAQRTDIEAEKNENYDKANASIQIALEIFRAKERTQVAGQAAEETQREAVDDTEVHDLFTCLLRAAEYRKLRDEQAAALDLMEEALERRPSASHCRWRLIEQLCRNDRHTRAQELFEEWSSVANTLKAKTPGEFLRERLTSDLLLRGELLPVVKLMQGTSIHHSVREAIVRVIKSDDELQKETDGVWLRYAHGMILAVEGGEENLDAAEKCWIEALDIGRGLILDDDTPMQWSSKLTCMRYFDQARRTFWQSAGTSLQRATVLLDDLSYKISRVLVPKYKELPESNRATAYIASLGKIMGQLDYTTRYLTEDMTNAIEILSDDDIWNDDVGIQRLFSVLLRYGDYEGALSAWSLLDRDETRGKAEQREEAKHVASVNGQADGSPPDRAEEGGARESVDEASEAGQTSDKEDGQATWEDVEEEGEGEEQQQEDGEEGKEKKEEGEDEDEDEGEEEEEEDEALKFWMLDCDNCSAPLISYFENEEIWWCKYCPFLRLCTPCKEKLQNGTLESYRCSPEHPLLLTKHFEYSKEELKGSNVLIDWKLTESEVDVEENGVVKKSIKRERTGGRIVELKEWLDILRAEWNITKTSSGGILQQ